MKDHDELPDGKKLRWPHSQEDFVTAVLAVGSHLQDVNVWDGLMAYTKGRKNSTSITIARKN